MTIVAYRDGVMAADRTTKSCGVEFHETCKVGVRADGLLVGCAGMSSLAEAVRRWFLAGELGDRPSFGKVEADSVHTLVVRPNGAIEVHDMDGMTPVVGDRGFVAVGSGFEIALGAMAMGASAIKAVEICAEFGVGRPGRWDAFYGPASPLWERPRISTHREFLERWEGSFAGT